MDAPRKSYVLLNRSDVKEYGDNNGYYVSCIKVDGIPILPPLMTEEKRLEMRKYRELACQRETDRKTILMSRLLLPSIETPAVIPVRNEEVGKHETANQNCIVSDGAKKDDEDDQENWESAESDESDSSTATFIILSNRSQSSTLNTSFLSEGEVVEIEEDDLEDSQNVSKVAGASSLSSNIACGAVPQIKTKAALTLDKDVVDEIPNLRPTNQLSSRDLNQDDSNSAISRPRTCESTASTIPSSMRMTEYEDDEDLDDAESMEQFTDNSYSYLKQFRVSGILTNKTGTDENISSASTTLTLTNHSSNSISSVCDSFGSMGLSKLKSKMRSMSPSLYKIASEVGSPVLKGVVFLNPLNRPRILKKIPEQASDPAMKPKFDRVTAAARGYLVRRLLHTEKVKTLVQTVKDTVELILNLYEEAPTSAQDSRVLRPEDYNLHGRLIQQLNGACGAFHDIFFTLTTSERMAIISTDRSKMLNKARKAMKVAFPHKKNISIATLRYMERRQTTSSHPVPKKAKLQSSKLPLHVPSHFIPACSKSPPTSPTVKTRSRISPKRRRPSTVKKSSTPNVPVRYPITARLSQGDRIKASSASSLNRLKVRPSSARVAPVTNRVSESAWLPIGRKKLDSTFVLPKKQRQVR